MALRGEGERLAALQGEGERLAALRYAGYSMSATKTRAQDPVIKSTSTHASRRKPRRNARLHIKFVHQKVRVDKTYLDVEIDKNSNFDMHIQLMDWAMTLSGFSLGKNTKGVVSPSRVVTLVSTEIWLKSSKYYCKKKTQAGHLTLVLPTFYPG